MQDKAFNKLYRMQSKNEQDIYLQSLSETRNIKQNRKWNPDGESRSRSYSYFLSFPDRRVKVCQGMFTRIHAVSLYRLKRIKFLTLNHFLRLRLACSFCYKKIN